VVFDFDIAVRDIAPIDSIVQTAGRCNRNGKRNANESPFYIYRLVDDKSGHAKYVYGEVSIDIAQSLLNTEKNIIDLVKSYYQEIQKRKSNQQSDKVNTAISQLNYEDVEKEFS
jgi:CRISPR-associated endonuclease/helicase Cas3